MIMGLHLDGYPALLNRLISMCIGDPCILIQGLYLLEDVEYEINTNRTGQSF